MPRKSGRESRRLWIYLLQHSSGLCRVNKGFSLCLVTYCRIISTQRRLWEADECEICQRIYSWINTSTVRAEPPRRTSQLNWSLNSNRNSPWTRAHNSPTRESPRGFIMTHDPDSSRYSKIRRRDTRSTILPKVLARQYVCVFVFETISIIEYPEYVRRKATR